MTCDETEPLLGAYFDSELDLTAALSVERHLAGCSSCAAHLKNLELLREELTPAVFHRLDASGLEELSASVRKAVPMPAVAAKRVWSQPALWAGLAAAAVFAIMLPLRQAGDSLDRELVDSHVRSLMANHLVDVPSSDRHTVKPWFQGKVDFAPDVPDLSGNGYELIGGRLDVLGGRQTAALVYRRGGHFVNLWISRTTAGDSGVRFSVVDGYQVAHWSAAGLDRAAVTDMNRGELQTFVELFQRK